MKDFLNNNFHNKLFYHFEYKISPPDISFNTFNKNIFLAKQMVIRLSKRNIFIIFNFFFWLFRLWVAVISFIPIINPF